MTATTVWDVVVFHGLRVPWDQWLLLVRNPSAAAMAAAVALFVGVAWLDVWGPRGVRLQADLIVHVLGFIVCAAGLVWFFRGGSFAWDVSIDGQKDWTYFAALGEAARLRELPYYLFTAHQGTERYLADPETPLLPYALVLSRLSIPAFFIAHLLMVFAAGYWGLVRLRRELALGAFSWAILVVLFVFNGHVTGQLSVIRTQWVSVFLLPWAFLCIVKAARGDMSWTNATVLACTLAGMMFLGGWHIFVWTVIFFLLLCIVSVRRIAFAAKALALTLLFGAARLLPGLLTFGAGTNVFQGGFEHAAVLIQALAGQLPNWIDGLDWFEYDAYVGYVGLGLICVGLIPQRRASSHGMNALLFPAVSLLVMSLDHVYASTLFHLPGFVSERIVSRFLIVSALALLLRGLVRADAWLRLPERSLLVRIGALGLAWFLVLQLVLAAYYIRPETKGLGLELPVTVIKHGPVEPAYVRTVWIGLTISAAAFFALASRIRVRRFRINL